jgi:hypothetical protein
MAERVGRRKRAVGQRGAGAVQPRHPDHVEPPGRRYVEFASNCAARGWCARCPAAGRRDASSFMPWSLTQGPEGCSQLLGEQLGLFPGGEVAALVGLVEVGEVGVGVGDPAAWGAEDLVGEGGEADRQRDLGRSLAGRGGTGLGLSAFPVLPGCRGAGAGQPVQRDVVQDVVPGEIARWLPIEEGMGDLVVAVGVVVQHPAGQGDG